MLCCCGCLRPPVRPSVRSSVLPVRLSVRPSVCVWHRIVASFPPLLISASRIGRLACLAMRPGSGHCPENGRFVLLVPRFLLEQDLRVPRHRFPRPQEEKGHLPAFLPPHHHAFARVGHNGRLSNVCRGISCASAVQSLIPICVMQSPMGVHHCQRHCARGHVLLLPCLVVWLFALCACLLALRTIWVLTSCMTGWKKYLTSFQIAQFFFDESVNLTWPVHNFLRGCSGTPFRYASAPVRGARTTHPIR
jgi:hypothetical protein